MIVGVDEVGRGCWAGPVVAGAVALGKARIKGLKDSKKLSKKQREVLAASIHKRAAAVGIGWVSPDELDIIGLTAAVRLAMERAMDQIAAPYDQIIIDGNYNFLAKLPNSTCVIKADDTIPAVSAASIVAKTARDAYMAAMSTEHPGYHFERHVGYGTMLHRAALLEQGICVLHRRSFAPIRAILEA